MKEEDFTGMPHRLGDEYLKMRDNTTRLHVEVQNWRAANPRGTVKEFVDAMVAQKKAIRLKMHPGFTIASTGW